MNPYSSGPPNIFAIDVALSSRISELEGRVAELEQVLADSGRVFPVLAALIRERRGETK
jgi:hypothetical protein